MFDDASRTVLSVTISGCVLSSLHYEGLSNDGDVIGFLFGDEKFSTQNPPSELPSDEWSQSSGIPSFANSVVVDIKGFIVCPHLSPCARESLSGDNYEAHVRRLVRSHGLYTPKSTKSAEYHPIVGTFACRQNTSVGPSLADTRLQSVLSRVLLENGRKCNLVFASFALEIDPLSCTQTVNYKFLQFLSEPWYVDG